MAFTELTLSITLAMISLFISLFVGTWGGKEERALLPSLLLFVLIIPIVFSFVYGFLTPIITLFDWPSSWFATPQMAIFAGSFIGGFLGLKAGMIWTDDNDRSCIQCLLVPISLVLVASLVILFFL
ncbi:MAG: hypothetical protein ACFFED_14275 [Candidatus Thorarchaeota archaeon]